PPLRCRGAETPRVAKRTCKPERRNIAATKPARRAVERTPTPQLFTCLLRLLAVSLGHTPRLSDYVREYREIGGTRLGLSPRLSCPSRDLAADACLRSVCHSPGDAEETEPHGAWRELGARLRCAQSAPPTSPCDGCPCSPVSRRRRIPACAAGDARLCPEGFVLAGHVSVAVAREQEKASPLSGAVRRGMEASVQVVPL